MTSFTDPTPERRKNLRFAINQQSRLRLTLDGAGDGSNAIEGVTLTDISQQGLMAANAGELIPGAHIMLEVPLVGWREVEVRWIAENRAGCRFLEPLSFEQLRLAAASSERLAAECPSLADEIADPDVAPVPAADEAQPSPEHRSRAWMLWIGLAALLLMTLAALLLS